MITYFLKVAFGGPNMLGKEKKIFNVFFRRKPALMLLGLLHAKEEIYASSLAKEINCTYSHVVKILQQMHKSGLIEFVKQGRIKLLRLTKKGQKVADHIDHILNLL